MQEHLGCGVGGGYEFDEELIVVAAGGRADDPVGTIDADPVAGG